MDEVQPQQPEPASPWKFSTGNAPPPAASQAPEPAPADDQYVEWTASEFVAHHKSFGWYVALAFGGLLLATVIYELTHDRISTGVVIFVIIMLGAAAGRKPRVLPYRIDRSGITIGQKLYPYGAFRSFFVAVEGAFSSITLMPTGRFMPDVSIYYDPKDESKILDVLGNHLPMERTRVDAVDRLMHRIRF